MTTQRIPTAPKTAITPTRDENYAEWYQRVIVAADLAEMSSVRGCMVIKPWGYRLWEIIQGSLDQKLRETGHENAYFPLFIPLSDLEKEARHVEGFAKECAVVTHTRLQANDDGHLRPQSPLEEPLVVRPTSETIIGKSFARWIQSYRDLPLLINQWANVVRWEMRPRLFLRTTEFLWQEGHTAHSNPEEAVDETFQMAEIYRQIVEEELAIPVILGEKTAAERFPGAQQTLTIEAMVQDGRSIQMGTSHFLGQNFSRAMNIEFTDPNGQKMHAWTTSWGVSTRLIGGLIMTHADDNGLVLPPRVAPLNVVIIPIVHDEEQRLAVECYARETAERCTRTQWAGRSVDAKVDGRDIGGGDKRWHWIKKGVPILLEIGRREVENGTLTLTVRDDVTRPRIVSRHEFLPQLGAELDGLQQRLLERAREFQNAHTQTVRNADEFYTFFRNKRGFVVGFWSEDPDAEAHIGEELKVTVRCLPLNRRNESGPCLFTHRPHSRLAVFAKSY
jgi:prolyl-tRNA synthetase